MGTFGKRLGLLGGLTGASLLAVAADSGGHQINPANGEATLGPVSWSYVAQMVDAERSSTLYQWNLRYAADRGKEPRPYSQLKALAAPRRLDLSGVDGCLAREGERELSFGTILQRNLETAMISRPIATNSVIDSKENGYNLVENRLPVSWMSHPLCGFDAADLQGELRHSLESRVVPDVALARDLNAYLNQSNYLRNRVIESNSIGVGAQRIAMSEYMAYQGILMSCLAYTESLSGTETQDGDQIYANLNRRAYVSKSQRPVGVSIGVDRPADYFVGNRSRDEQKRYGLSESMATFTDSLGRSQPRYLKYSDSLKKDLEAAASDQQKIQIKQAFVGAQLAAIREAKAKGMSDADIHTKFFSDISSAFWVSAGTYQFKFGNLDTDKGDVLDSNIGPCVTQWNEIYGERCKIGHSIADYANALSSPGQAFNIFCGTQKLLQSFNVQVHTQNPTMTAKQNLKPDGTLKAPEDRCVHPFWKGGRAYNHFGPLANSAPKGSIQGLTSFPGNLAILNECIHNNGRTLFQSR